MFQELAAWRLSLLDLAGPTALVTVIITWILVEAFGWALVYWPYLPSEFRFASGIPDWAQGRFVDALYASFVTLATLGFGDITPTTTWLRLITPLEALIGFAILTAGLSWVMSVYPVLHRRSSFAHRVLIARRTGTIQGREMPSGDPILVERIIAGLTELRGDLQKFPITFYFREGDSKSAFPIALAVLISHIAATPASPARESMQMGLTDLTEHIGERFLGGVQPPHTVISEIVSQHRWNENLKELLDSVP